MHVLVKFEANYADEFDVYGLKVCTSEEWDKYLRIYEAEEFPNEWYFGTNEQIEYDSFAEFLSRFTVTEISDIEYLTLTKLIGEDYGAFPNWCE